ncbi:unnamed protein product [Periconia digitata]|uniref:FAD-binding PCMH-type domain-containing protein n=1 Tax=Periconia digitata TaxID=1303443 RepID=A0A9W4UIH0_9PLEO|nr:unnamed protein product [Periconia digitata]
MKFSFTFLALVLRIPAYAAENEYALSDFSTGPKAACAILKSRYPESTFLTNSSSYTTETQQEYWSATAWSNPACVFVPRDAEEVASAVNILTLTQSQFAVRSGGHMPIPGFNGINSDGILLSTSDLTRITLSDDRSVVSIGAGNRWREVYSYLAPFGLAAAGGRVGGVGVSGFTLGGGISFYSSQVGFGADTVVKFECVLADGSIVEATATNAYSDLFWALKGGGNSFAIVTRFDYKTLTSPEVYVGVSQYPEPQAHTYLEAVYNFGKYGLENTKAAIIPTIVRLPGANITAYAAARFYDGNTENPRVFENFTSPKLTPIVDGYTKQSLADYVTQTDVLQPTGLRQEFRTVSMVVDRKGMELVHDIFLEKVNTELSGVANLTSSITFQPISAEFIRQGTQNGGNPQAVGAHNAPYFWIVANWSWTDKSNDELVADVADETVKELEIALSKNGVLATYQYLNDAGKGQKVFQGYPSVSVERLRRIRLKYDPLRIFTDMMPGGWKIDHI